MTPQEKKAAALIRKWGDQGFLIKFSQVYDLEKALLEERQEAKAELLKELEERKQ